MIPQPELRRRGLAHLRNLLGGGAAEALVNVKDILNRADPADETSR
jgi:hypothetical protein